MLNSILTQDQAISGVSAVQFLICTAASLVLGILCAFIYMYKNKYNKSFVVTLALMPAIVQLVIMLVNGNIGTGVAVMGAFSLVRFRSIPGTAKDIGSIFFAMAIGLATGMGYIVAAAVFMVILAAANIILTKTKFAEGDAEIRQLRITIPENLDFIGLYDDVFDKYTMENSLIRVKTVNMGSLFELTYDIKLTSDDIMKEFIDELRCRNGNLRIILGLVPENKEVM